MVAAPLKTNGVPRRVKSKASRFGSNASFGVNLPRHWPTERRVGSPTGAPSASTHGELNAGSVKPIEKFSDSLVAPTVPPNLKLCAPDRYATSTFAPKFVKRRFCDTVPGVSANGSALGE